MCSAMIDFWLITEIVKETKKLRSYMTSGNCFWWGTLLQGLIQNSNIYSGCRRTKQQGWRNFPTCVYLQGQWTFPTHSNIHSGSFHHIPISTVEVSNTFQYPQWKFPTLSNMNTVAENNHDWSKINSSGLLLWDKPLGSIARCSDISWNAEDLISLS